MSIEAETCVSSFLELSKEFGVSLKMGASLIVSASHTSVAIDVSLIETTTGRTVNVNGKPAVLGPTKYHGIVISESTYKERLKRFYELFLFGGNVVLSTHKAEVRYSPNNYEQEFEAIWANLMAGVAKNFK